MNNFFFLLIICLLMVVISDSSQTRRTQREILQRIEYPHRALTFDELGAALDRVFPK